MVQDETIKFRITKQDKARLKAAAERSGKPVSHLLRRAALRATAHQPFSAEVRADAVALRRALNILVAAETSPTIGDFHAAQTAVRKLLRSLP